MHADAERCAGGPVLRFDPASVSGVVSTKHNGVTWPARCKPVACRTFAFLYRDRPRNGRTDTSFRVTSDQRRQSVLSCGVKVRECNPTRAIRARLPCGHGAFGGVRVACESDATTVRLHLQGVSWSSGKTPSGVSPCLRSSPGAVRQHAAVRIVCRAESGYFAVRHELIGGSA